MAQDNVKKIIAKVNKDLGVGTVKRLGDDRTYLDVKIIPTGSLTLDMILLVGGLPRGRTVELFGPEASGKTTVALHAIAEAQKQGHVAAFVDAEHALDKNLAIAYGVDMENLIINQPDTGEQALDVVEALAKAGVAVVAVDSVAALLPEAEAESQMGDQHMGLHGRLMSKALRKITKACYQNDCTVIFINQLREKIGGYGNPETTPGGRALKFYASIRIDVRRGDLIRQNNEIIGHRMKLKAVKNKVAVPYKQGEVDLIYGVGFNRINEIAELAMTAGILARAGAYYRYTDKAGKDHQWMGKDSTKEALAENETLMEEIADKLLNPSPDVAEGLDAELEE